MYIKHWRCQTQTNMQIHWNGVKPNHLFHDFFVNSNTFPSMACWIYSKMHWPVQHQMLTGCAFRILFAAARKKPSKLPIYWCFLSSSKIALAKAMLFCKACGNLPSIGKRTQMNNCWPVALFAGSQVQSQAWWYEGLLWFPWRWNECSAGVRAGTAIVSEQTLQWVMEQHNQTARWKMRPIPNDTQCAHARNTNG